LDQFRGAFCIVPILSRSICDPANPKKLSHIHSLKHIATAEHSTILKLTFIHSRTSHRQGARPGCVRRQGSVWVRW
jgi:hypothetical protein